MKKIIITLILNLLIVSPNIASANFKISEIRIVGLENISSKTVLAYIPVKVGQYFDEKRSADIVRKLYATRFFDNVSLEAEGKILIVKVVERYTIDHINVKGNKALTSSKLEELMQDLNLRTGRFYNHATVDKFKQILIEKYQDIGYYSVQIKSTVMQKKHRRIDVAITVNEGRIAKIRKITILGTSRYSAKQIRRQLHLTTPGFLTLLTQNDRYSPDKLDADLEFLKIFYLDNGYANFKVVSKQVSISDDKQDVYITLMLDEGDRFKFSGSQFIGNLLFPESKLKSLVGFKKNDYFSRQAIVAASHAVGEFYGGEGYTFAKINVLPNIDKTEKTVFITYHIEPGSQVYVHKINFSGNNKSADEVLRREMRQMEGAVISTKKIEESKRQLYLQGYFSNVDSNMVAIPGHDNLVDLDFKVKETASGNANFGIGYSDADGFLYNASIDQPNFLGSGKTFGFGFDNSALNQSYWMRYFDPYYTIDGIGRGFNLSYKRSSPNSANLGKYTVNNLSGSVSYSIPLSNDQSFQFGFSVQQSEINLGAAASTQIKDFIAEHGSDYKHLLTTVGWSHNTQDRAIFPRRGLAQGISLVLSAPLESTNQLTYYKVGYAGTYYHPIKAGFVFQSHANLSYGSGYSSMDELPFFQNYFAGGIGSVRGYDSYSLGPKDSNLSALGGNLLLTGSVGIVLPTFISENVRFTLFIDGGNVYNTKANTIASGRFSLDEMRFGAGLGVEWRSPMAPLVFSLAKPLNKKAGDNTQLLSFNIGIPF